MNVTRGDVVLVDFPFASGSGRKLRPAVVVQSNAFNQRLNTTILAPVTSNTKHANEACQVVVDPTTHDGTKTGLLRPSSIKCENLATVETQIIRRRIGEIPASIHAQLDAALKSSLSLS